MICFDGVVWFAACRNILWGPIWVLIMVGIAGYKCNILLRGSRGPREWNFFFSAFPNQDFYCLHFYCECTAIMNEYNVVRQEPPIRKIFVFRFLFTEDFCIRSVKFNSNISIHLTLQPMGGFLRIQRKIAQPRRGQNHK